MFVVVVVVVVVGIERCGGVKRALMHGRNAWDPWSTW
jgi:hypothetical protein